MAQILHTNSAAPESTASVPKTNVLFGPLAAIILGVLLIGGAGLAAPEALHNAAHDSRHSLAFPCH